MIRSADWRSTFSTRSSSLVKPRTRRSRPAGRPGVPARRRMGRPFDAAPRWGVGTEHVDRHERVLQVDQTVNRICQPGLTLNRTHGQVNWLRRVAEDRR